jgi:hypothetical protein
VLGEQLHGRGGIDLSLRHGLTARQLATLADSIFVSGALGRDGKSIIAARGVFHRDVFGIKDFK